MAKHNMIKPVLLFGYGNPSRGDDALGSLLLEAMVNSSGIDQDGIEILTDFQLQIEHALDMEGRYLILFVDASVSCHAPCEFQELKSNQDNSYTTHTMSPAAVLQVYQSIKKENPPPSFLLSIKAEQFGLGEPLSGNAKENLQQAKHFAEQLLADPALEKWLELVKNARNIAA